jgi:Zn-finger nucleic acid-binding protein
MGILCPRCDLSLNELTKTGVTVDLCVNCRGMWLDRGELEKLLVRPGVPERKKGRTVQCTETSSGVPTRTVWPATRTHGEGTLRCPRCAKPLREARRDGVRLDTCAGCHGVWLDCGELERIKARRWELQHDGAYDDVDPGKLIRWGRPVRYPRRHPHRHLAPPVPPPEPHRGREFPRPIRHRSQDGHGTLSAAGPSDGNRPDHIVCGERQTSVKTYGSILAKALNACRPVAGAILMVLGLVMMFVPVLPGTPLLLAGMAIAGSSHPVVRFLRERWRRWRRKGREV